MLNKQGFLEDARSHLSPVLLASEVINCGIIQFIHISLQMCKDNPNNLFDGGKKSQMGAVSFNDDETIDEKNSNNKRIEYSNIISYYYLLNKFFVSFHFSIFNVLLHHILKK